MEHLEARETEFNKGLALLHESGLVPQTANCRIMLCALFDHRLNVLELDTLNRALESLPTEIDRGSFEQTSQLTDIIIGLARFGLTAPEEDKPTIQRVALETAAVIQDTTRREPDIYKWTPYPDIELINVDPISIPKYERVYPPREVVDQAADNFKALVRSRTLEAHERILEEERQRKEEARKKDQRTATRRVVKTVRTRVREISSHESTFTVDELETIFDTEGIKFNNYKHFRETLARDHYSYLRLPAYMDSSLDPEEVTWTGNIGHLMAAIRSGVATRPMLFWIPDDIVDDIRIDVTDKNPHFITSPWEDQNIISWIFYNVFIDSGAEFDMSSLRRAGIDKSFEGLREISPTLKDIITHYLRAGIDPDYKDWALRELMTEPTRASEFKGRKEIKFVTAPGTCTHKKRRPMSFSEQVAHEQKTMRLHEYFMFAALERLGYNTRIDHSGMTMPSTINMRGRAVIINFNNRVGAYRLNALNPNLRLPHRNDRYCI